MTIYCYKSDIINIANFNIFLYGQIFSGAKKRGTDPDPLGKKQNQRGQTPKSKQNR